MRPVLMFSTTTLTIDAWATSEDGICAFTCCGLINVVVRAAPFHKITERFEKFAPRTVKTKLDCPAVTAVGEMLMACGTVAAPATGSLPATPQPSCPKTRA